MVRSLFLRVLLGVIAVLVVAAPIILALHNFQAEDDECQRSGGALAKTARGWSCVVMLRETHYVCGPSTTPPGASSSPTPPTR